MKKIRLLFVFVLLLSFGMKVNASNISLDKFVGVINKGDVTNAFEKAFPKDSTVSILASKKSDTEISVQYVIVVPKYEKGEIVSYESDTAFLSFYYDSTTNMLVGERTYDTKSDVVINPYITHVLKLVPYWAVEASSRYENVKGYLGSEDLLKTFAKIFDRCYLDKMGVCYTEITEYTNITYRAKVEMSDKGADYAIDYFKEIERQEEDDAFLGFLFKIFMVLVALVVIVCLLRGVLLSVTKK